MDRTLAKPGRMHIIFKICESEKLTIIYCKLICLEIPNQNGGVRVS